MNDNHINMSAFGIGFGEACHQLQAYFNVCDTGYRSCRRSWLGCLYAATLHTHIEPAAWMSA